MASSNKYQSPAVVEDVGDSRSEFGVDVGSGGLGFGGGDDAGQGLYAEAPTHGGGGEATRSTVFRPAGVVRSAPASARAYGRGDVAVDPRKFRYDRNRARAMPVLPFGASRADRMDAGDAGDALERIHVMYGINRDTEDVIAAFDKALFFEHTINGASMLQSARGTLTVGASHFDLSIVKTALGVDQRRFFRAYADDIADVNREVIKAYDAYEPTSVEKYGQLMQVAVERGLQKFPYLAHDSSDAGVRLSVEERVALIASKKIVLESVVNNVDKLPARAGSGLSV